MTDLSAVWLSVRVTLFAMMLVLPLGLALALLLAFRRFSGKIILETVLTLPLVLPPTVIGYGLLLVLGHGTPLGKWLNESAGVQLLFTGPGIVIAAAVMALPLFVRTAASALSAVDPALLEAARLDGAGHGGLLRHVLLPLASRGLLAGALLAAARALGEFGATLMVGGSIPGKTETLPLALYNAVQSGQDRVALATALWLTLAAFLLVFVVSHLHRTADSWHHG